MKGQPGVTGDFVAHHCLSKPPGGRKGGSLDILDSFEREIKFDFHQLSLSKSSTDHLRDLCWMLFVGILNFV